jgi:hypothetical protein
LRRKNGHRLLLLPLPINLDVSPLIVDASAALKDTVPATALAYTAAQNQKDGFHRVPVVVQKGEVKFRSTYDEDSYLFLMFLEY